MNVQTIQKMFAYTAWANERVLEALEQLSDEEAKKPLSGSFASAQDTFAHFIAGEWIWLQRWKGKSPSSMPDWVSNGDMAKIGETMRDVAEEMRVRLQEVTEAELDMMVTYHNLAGDESWRVRVGDMLLHVANHSTYHRGQLASKLRELGVTPPSTDLLIYAAHLARRVESEIVQLIKHVVFEPNNEGTWSRVRDIVSKYLNQVWREGYLIGATSNEAFYVKCDSETNTREDQNLGRINIEVGIATEEPAEFLVLRIGYGVEEL